MKAFIFSLLFSFSALAANPPGSVYRIYFQSSNAAHASKEITALIASLGGKKAKRVELGTEISGGYYFNFSLPEKNYETLLQGLEKFGSSKRISKDSNKQTMPAGLIRLVLWVKNRS